jgi:hypothetical protein
MVLTRTSVSPSSRQWLGKNGTAKARPADYPSVPQRTIASTRANPPLLAVS